MKQKKQVVDCYNKAAVAYAKQFYGELAHKPLDRLLLQRFATKNKGKGKVADLGCGSGQTTAFLYEAGLTDIVGIDLAPNMIIEARKLNPQIDFEVGNMLDLGYKESYFAAVVAFYAIVHFDYEELEKAFVAINRVTQKGGQFLFSFHAEEQIIHTTDFLEHKVAINFYCFDMDKLLDLVKKCGWEVKDALLRYPYPDKEYPSKRGYVVCEKL